jgi:hypothetical protein
MINEAAVGVDNIGDTINPGVEFNGARIEVPGPSTRLDRHNRSEWTGPTLTGLIVGLLCNLRTYGPQEAARRQDRRAMTIAARQDDHRAFSVIIAGWWDTLVVGVLEGKGQI